MSPHRPVLLSSPSWPAVLLLGLLWSCSAPDIEDMPGHGVPAPPPEPDPLPAAPAPPPPPEPQRPAPQAAPPALQPSLEATPETTVGTPPYTAWTAQAPLSPVGPGGRPVLRLRRVGVRVEVAQVLDERTRFTCTGCAGAEADTEAWVQPGRLRIAGAHGDRTDPLAVALRLRAQWAGGSGLPEGMSRAMGCLLVDRGFTLHEGQPPRAVWEAEGGRLVLEWREESWTVAEVQPPARELPWSCRTTRPG